MGPNVNDKVIFIKCTKQQYEKIQKEKQQQQDNED